MKIARVVGSEISNAEGHGKWGSERKRPEAVRPWVPTNAVEGQIASAQPGLVVGWGGNATGRVVWTANGNRREKLSSCSQTGPVFHRAGTRSTSAGTLNAFPVCRPSTFASGK